MLFFVTAIGGVAMVAAAIWVILKPFEEEPEAEEIRSKPREVAETAVQAD